MRNPIENPMAPWHLWGNTVQLVTDADISGGNTASGQVLKVGYKRPETFSFFFAAQLLNLVTPDPTTDVIVLFDVMAGIGRTMFDTQAQGNILVAPGFARFVFRVAPPFIEGPTNRKYTTVGSGPPQDDSLPLILPRIDWLAAQDIQVQARARISGTPGSRATVECTAWFAPRSHVRPEWFSDTGNENERFRGGETGGL